MTASGVRSEPASSPALSARSEPYGGARYLWIGLSALGITLAAVAAIWVNLRELETRRTQEYRQLAEQLGKMAGAYTAMKQYDHLLDLMQLLTRSSALLGIALQINGETVLRAGRALPQDTVFPAASQASVRVTHGVLPVWVPLAPDISRLPERSGLGLVFSLTDLTDRKRNILAFSAVLLGLLIALTVLLQVLDRTSRRLHARNLELHETQERLRRAEEMRSLMVRYLAHNANNHLNVLAAKIAALRALNAAGQPLTSLPHDLETMEATQSSVAYLIRNLHDHDRLSRGEVKLDLRSVDLPGLVQSVAKGLAALAAEKRIRLTLRTGPAVQVLSDPHCLEQVLMNLFVNAIRYSGDGTVVESWVDAGPDRIVVSVRDQGPGIAEADRERVFEPFVRLRPEGPKGSGLGLANSRLLVRQLGGDIWVQDSRPNAGSTFSFSIPTHASGTVSGEAVCAS
jgi:signal transduction histidine kinase